MNKKKLLQVVINAFLISIFFFMILAKSFETPAQTKQESPGTDIQTEISTEDETSIRETIILYCKLAKEGNFSDLEKTIVTESHLKEVAQAHAKEELKTLLKNNPNLVIKEDAEIKDSKTRRAVIDSSPIDKFEYQFMTREIPSLIYEKQLDLKELMVSNIKTGAVVQVYFLL